MAPEATVQALEHLEASLDTSRPSRTCVSVYEITNEIRQLKAVVKELVSVIRAEKQHIGSM